MSKKESYWFSHDSNAASSPEMIALKRKYGYEGYGRWWRLVERLRECEEYHYDISVPFAWDVLGQDLDMTAEEAQAFVQDCIDYFKLLQTDGHFFWSDNLLDRMEYWEKRREVLRERGRKGGLARKGKGDDSNDTVKQSISISLSTSTPQVSNNLCTTEANETIQNQTKPNETTFIKVDEDNNNNNEHEKQEVVMEQESVFSVLRTRALADGQRFVFPYVSSGRVNKEQLGDWLMAFNTWLEFTGEQIKEERDYRRHFAAWFKFRNPATEDPKQYNPAAPKQKEPESTGMPLRKVLPAPQKMPLADAPPAAQTPEAETPPPPPAKTLPLPIQLPEEQPTGKFSKRDNKYDMHWLKNMRDELRRTGQ